MNFNLSNKLLLSILILMCFLTLVFENQQEEKRNRNLSRQNLFTIEQKNTQNETSGFTVIIIITFLMVIILFLIISYFNQSALLSQQEQKIKNMSKLTHVDNQNKNLMQIESKFNSLTVKYNNQKAKLQSTEEIRNNIQNDLENLQKRYDRDIKKVPKRFPYDKEKHNLIVRENNLRQKYEACYFQCRQLQEENERLNNELYLVKKSKAKFTDQLQQLFLIEKDLEREKEKFEQEKQDLDSQNIHKDSDRRKLNSKRIRNIESELNSVWENIINLYNNQFNEYLREIQDLQNQKQELEKIQVKNQEELAKLKDENQDEDIVQELANNNNIENNKLEIEDKIKFFESMTQFIGSCIGKYKYKQHENKKKIRCGIIEIDSKTENCLLIVFRDFLGIEDLRKKMNEDFAILINFHQGNRSLDGHFFADLNVNCIKHRSAYIEIKSFFNYLFDFLFQIDDDLLQAVYQSTEQNKKDYGILSQMANSFVGQLDNPLSEKTLYRQNIDLKGEMTELTAEQIKNCKNGNKLSFFKSIMKYESPSCMVYSLPNEPQPQKHTFFIYHFYFYNLIKKIDDGLQKFFQDPGNEIYQKKYQSLFNSCRSKIENFLTE